MSKHTRKQNASSIFTPFFALDNQTKICSKEGVFMKTYFESSHCSSKKVVQWICAKRFDNDVRIHDKVFLTMLNVFMIDTSHD